LKLVPLSEGLPFQRDNNPAFLSTRQTLAWLTATTLASNIMKASRRYPSRGCSPRKPIIASFSRGSSQKSRGIVVLVNPSVALLPLVELAGPDPQPGDEPPDSKLGLFRPAPLKSTVQARTWVMNQLQAVALNEGLRCKKRLWRQFPFRLTSFRNASRSRAYTQWTSLFLRVRSGWSAGQLR